MIYAVVLAVVVAGVFCWLHWRRARAAARRRQAVLDFEQQQSRLADELLVAAAASGKPRGLRWTASDLSGEPLFAVDDASSELFALVAVTVSFEAIEGGGMEEVEAVSNLRSGTAVFVNRGREWTTDGRVVFNLEPAEALQRFQSTLRLVATD